MSISTQRVLRELREAYPTAELSFTGSGHIRMRFPDGAIVFVSASPSKIHFMTYVHQDVKYARLRRHRR